MIKRVFKAVQFCALVCAWLMFGCTPDAKSADADKAAIACSTKGAFVIALHGGVCSPGSKAALEDLAKTDPDCRATFGDAGVTVTCPMSDGGAE